MSVHVTAWVLKHSEAKLGDRLVLLVLADHANDDGSSAWPSVETIAHQARLSDRQVKRCLKNLREGGAIEETGKSRKGTTIYTVAMGGDNTSPLGGDIHDTEGVTSATEGGDRMSPDPPVVQPPEGQPPVELDARAYDPLVGVKVEGQDLPWNSLASLTQAGGKAYGPRMRTAMQSIRADVVEWVTERQPLALERAASDPHGFEQAIARTVEMVARRIVSDATPGLTWGPEGIARNFRRGLALIEQQSSTTRGLDDIVKEARG